MFKEPFECWPSAGTTGILNGTLKVKIELLSTLLLITGILLCYPRSYYNFFGFISCRIVKVRETRLTGLFSHILIGVSMLLLPYPLAYIPTAVLDGLFLYMAVTALNGNQMFERITLLFMEQVNYQIVL